MKSWIMPGALILNAMLWPFVALSQQEAVMGDVTVQAAWTRATTPENRTAAVYFTISNIGKAQIDLIGVRTDRASIETLHQTTIDLNGIARMSAKPEQRIKPGSTISFEPGGLHVMLIDVEKPLIEGEILPLRLEFYDGDDLTVDVPILALDADGPAK